MAKEITVTTHVLVPKHTLLTEEEVTAILTRYNISKRQLPQISIKDAAIQHLTPKVGDIVCINRESPTRGISTFYRTVV